MATQIQIFDIHNNEVNLKDIVLINYPNPNCFFIGMVQFNEASLQFEVCDCLGHKIPLRHSTSISFEKLCRVDQSKATVKDLGLHDLKGGKAAAKRRVQILSKFNHTT